VAVAAVRELPLDLDAFEGPFDLLLTLVLKEELPLADVAVAEIVLAFVDGLTRLDGERAAGPAGLAPTADEIELCGEFLVLVAALLELKARELLDDGAEVDLDELDPEEAAAELAERLAAYRRVKAGAAWLADRLSETGSRYFRVGPAPCAPRPARELAPHAPALLAAAVQALAAEPPAPSLAHLALRLPPVERFVERFRALVRRQRSFSFDAEVEGLSRLEVAVAFVALLELGKASAIRIEQDAPFAPISVRAP
jgi:segregation and condensation protein A